MSWTYYFMDELEKIADQYGSQLVVPRQQMVQMYKGVYPVPEPTLLQEPKIKKTIGTAKRVGSTALKMLAALERKSQMPVRKVPVVPRSIL